MENNQLGGNKKENMTPSKPPLSPIWRFQGLQNTLSGDAAGTSSSNSLPQNQNNKVENFPATNAASIAEYTSKLIEQVQAENPDMDLKAIKRMVSSRLSSRRSSRKKMRYRTNLNAQLQTSEDQVAELKSKIEFLKQQMQFLVQENQTIREKMEIWQKKMLLKHYDIENNKGQVNRLRELHRMKQAEIPQPQMLNWNAGLQNQVPNIGPFPNYNTNSYQVTGNEVVGTTYNIPPTDLSQMLIPSMDETNLLGSMVPNMNQMNLSHSNFMEMEPMLPNMNEASLYHPNYMMGSMAPNALQTNLGGLAYNMGSMVSNVDETNLSFPNYMDSMVPNVDEMNLSHLPNPNNMMGSMVNPTRLQTNLMSDLPYNMGSMAPNVDETNLMSFPNYMDSMVPNMHGMNLSNPNYMMGPMVPHMDETGSSLHANNYMGSMEPNQSRGTFLNRNNLG